MHVGINPSKAPLARYNSDHLKAIKLKELTENLKARGVEITGGGEGAVTISLRNLLTVNGSISRAQQELMSVLRELGADAVTLEPADLEYIGGRDIFTHAVSRGLQARVPQIEALLCDIAVDDDDNETIPLFDRIERANIFAATDVHPVQEVRDKLLQGAERDLMTNTTLLGNANYNYSDFLEPRVEEMAPLPDDFITRPKPYRSIFDRSND